MSGCVLLALLQCDAVCASKCNGAAQLVSGTSIKHTRIYTLRTLHLAHLLSALALVDQAVAALILPSNNIELAGGIHLPC